MGPRSQPSPATVAARVADTVFALRRHATSEPAVGVVLGSGLGAFADAVEGLERVAFADLPHMPAPAVAGHPGYFCFGRVRGVPVVCMQGRVHLYEGHSVDTVVLGARAIAGLGVRCVLLTNAAGALQPSWSPGDLMAVSDHINLTGTSPLIGPNDDAIGPRFLDMTSAYDAALRAELHAVAREAGISLREGVYAGLLGPQYETPAEVRMLRALGADAVGMSTVLETIALRHVGVRVGAMSCITNLAAGIADRPLDHTEVEATARARRSAVLALLEGWIARAGAAI
jgi:purine-nucleoside phosphorylase